MADLITIVVIYPLSKLMDQVLDTGDWIRYNVDLFGGELGSTERCVSKAHAEVLGGLLKNLDIIKC